MKSTQRWGAAFAAAVCAGLAAGAQASEHTIAECIEGSEFIGNAAHARENGMSREAFLSRLEEDFQLIKAYPPQMRWFAKDREDEAFLYESARDVFDQPQTPERHRARFLAACLGRGKA